jgi:hypothetical protein
MSATTRTNIFLALLLSLILSVLFLVLYALYPLVPAIMTSLLRSPDTGGIAAVAGGASDSLLKVLLIEPIVFLIVFTLLQRRRARR